MRIKAITPIHVPAEELRRRQQRYDAHSPAGITVELVNLPPDDDVPRALDSPADIRASDRLVGREAERTDPTRFDAVLADCVLDPGIDAAAPVPVHGITRLVAAYLAARGQRFAAVTRNAAIGAELVDRIEADGHADHFDRLVVLGLELDDITDEARWDAALDGVRAELASTGVSAIVNGCSAVEVGPADGIPVIDPTRLALRLLADGVPTS